MKKILISGSLVVLWMIMIFLLSGMNSIESNSKTKGIVGKIIGEVEEYDVTVMKEVNETNLDTANFIFRKIAHATVYLVLSFFVCNFFYQLKKNKIQNNYLISVFICLLYAITDEYHQTFILGRSGNYIDVIIDFIGAIIGSIIFYYLVKIIKKKKKNIIFNGI